MTCRFCGKPREQHLTYRPAGAPVPRMPCLGLRARYLEAPQVEAAQSAPTHLVKIRLCEACLRGEGDECHTPECALCFKNSPGVPLDPALYEIIDDQEAT